MVETEHLQYVLDKQLGWIASADARLSLVLPLSTAMLGSLAVFAPKPNAWNLAAGLPAALATLFLCLSIIFCALACFPRTSGTDGSMIFFEGIRSRSVEEFASAAHSTEATAFANDLLEQCHINAEIASSKFRWVKRSITSLLISMLPWAITIYELYGVAHGAT